MIKKIFPLIYILCLSAPLLAQQGELGNWLMYFGQNRINKKYSIHTEVQYRSHKTAPVHTEQLLLRTGVNYHFSPDAFATLGYGYIASHDFESDQTSPESEEHRIWQQLIANNKLGRVKFEHRYRIEQRWVNGDYKNRLRYRLMLFIPINKPTMEKGAVFLGLYDEIFVNTRQTFFDRNRLYGAVGYQFSKTTSAQIGLLHQQINAYGKYYLQFGVVFNPVL